MKKTLAGAVILCSLLLSGTATAPFQNSLLHRELAMLDERGVAFRMLTGNQLEITDPRSGQRWMFDADRVLTPRKPTYDTIPTLTVNLTSIDTNLYNWKFDYVNSIPLTGAMGFPLEVSDFDQNGEPEAYGIRQTQSDRSTRIYELQTIGDWMLRYTFSGEIGTIDKSGDVDGNGLREVYARYGDSMFVFEQATLDSIPTTSKFRHRQWYYSATGIPNQVDWMTGGTVPEIVYRGSEPDTNGPPTTNIEKTYVVRHEASLNDFHRIWGAQLPPGCQAQECTGQIATGDFDADGKMEFATSNFTGNVFVVEHTAGDSFAVVWSTNLSVAGRAAAGDVDGNGITEFFIGGTQVEADGYVHLRAYAFERTGDNAYQPVFGFNIFPAGIFFVDLYQTADVDGDNIPELLLSFAGGIMVIKSAGEHNYQLFYYRPVSFLDGVAAWKIENNTAAHLFVSRSIGSQQVISQTDVYSLDSTLIVGVGGEDVFPKEVQLFQNYPNPFNPVTTIGYEIPCRASASLKVYDLLGREVMILVDGEVAPGSHQITIGATSLSSGIYFYRLTAGEFTTVKKFVVMK